VKRLGAVLVVGAVLGTVLVAASAAGDRKNAGFHTSAAAMLTGVNGSTVQPIISVGDTLGDGYTFESIPDGIAVGKVNGKGTFDVYVNHELSQVPFGNLGGTPPQTRADATNSLLSRLRLHQKSAGVLRGSYVIPSSAGYQRFCSNFMVGEAQGFERALILTNEEARDIVLRQEDSWDPGITLATPGAEQAGVAVAYDLKSGQYKSIYSMGRSNHENEVAVPGYGHPVVFTGDDTFDAPASQLYMLSAKSGTEFWNDQGTLYAFVSDNAAVNDYGDLTTASPSVTGHFIPVPEAIAKGKLNGHEVTTADFPAENFPLPPAGVPNGPQWVLEAWSNKNNVFQFIRIEDLAYDRTNGKILYFADTGEPRAVPDATTTRLRRAASGTEGPYPNGRLYKLALNSSDPTGTATLSILPGANFDDNGYRKASSPHQPDNVETTRSAIYFQEDPGGHNAQSATFPDATNARVWRYDLASHALTVVAEVDQLPAQSGITSKGSWESSGIVDVSRFFGPGTFLVDVQAHGWELPGTIPTDDPNVVPKRERGQLLLLKVPGETGNAAEQHSKSKGKAHGKAKKGKKK
jgi:hypothetical protein